LRIQLEGTVESLWKQFQDALKDYNDTTEDRKVAFEILKGKDERSAREIDNQMRKLQKIHVRTEECCEVLFETQNVLFYGLHFCTVANIIGHKLLSL